MLVVVGGGYNISAAAPAEAMEGGRVVMLPFVALARGKVG
jgi:hypothetical protein